MSVRPFSSRTCTSYLSRLPLGPSVVKALTCDIEETGSRNGRANGYGPVLLVSTLSNVLHFYDGRPTEEDHKSIIEQASHCSRWPLVLFGRPAYQKGSTA
jgi:hypothetical protein